MIPAVLPASISEINGAKLWIRIGGFSIQPGEFAKLALLSFFAYYLVRKREVLSLASKRFLGIDFPRGRDLGPVLVVWLLSLLVLVFEKDLGTSLLYFGMFVVTLYIATERVSWLIIGLLLFFGGAFLGVPARRDGRRPVRQLRRPGRRSGSTRSPTPTTSGYQLVQSLLGLGTGGLFGAGPGRRATPDRGARGAQRLHLRRHRRGDRPVRADRAAGRLPADRRAGPARRRSPCATRSASCSPAASRSRWALQVFVIVGGISGLIPLTGQTTPFLSAGGSSLMANWLLLALLLRISDAARRPVAGVDSSRPSGAPASARRPSCTAPRRR